MGNVGPVLRDGGSLPDRGAGDFASKAKTPETVMVPVLQLEGGRKLVFERSFSYEREAKPKRGFWNKVVDVVAGEPEFHRMVRPYSVVSDSKGRIIVTDPGAPGVHIFDFEHEKYKFLSHAEGKDAMRWPQCVAVDAQDNIYVTDSDAGKVFVFDAGGKLRQVIGSLKGGEGMFKRPTGIAVDSAAQRIFVSDTYRNQIFMMDMHGSVLAKFGKGGEGNGEFNFPTELRLEGRPGRVVDAMNFRVQVFDHDGTFQYTIGRIGDGERAMYPAQRRRRRFGRHIYLVEGLQHRAGIRPRRAVALHFGQGPALGRLPVAGGIVHR